MARLTLEGGILILELWNITLHLLEMGFHQTHYIWRHPSLKSISSYNYLESGTKGLENMHPPRRKNISYNLKGGEFITNRYQLHEIYIAAK